MSQLARKFHFRGAATQGCHATPPVPPWEVFKEVERSKFLSMLDTLLAIVDRASSTGVPVVCFGD